MAKRKGMIRLHRAAIGDSTEQNTIIMNGRGPCIVLYCTYSKSNYYLRMNSKLVDKTRAVSVGHLRGSAFLRHAFPNRNKHGYPVPRQAHRIETTSIRLETKLASDKGLRVSFCRPLENLVPASMSDI